MASAGARACARVHCVRVHAWRGAHTCRCALQVIAFRKGAAVWENAQVQRYSDDTFYAFTRGNTFVAMTNVGGGGASQSRPITYHPYPNGQRLCNLFDCNDCVTVANGEFTVQLDAGVGKVYDPSIVCV